MYIYIYRERERERETERERDTFLGHVAVYMKLTQHCKLTILQFFLKDEKKLPEPAHFRYSLHFFPS